MKYLLTFLFTFCILHVAFAQSSIGIGIAQPDSSAALDITSTSKGLLIPRMDSLSRLAIVNPPTGLMVFQTNERMGFWYSVNGAWLYIPDKTNSGDGLGNHSATQNVALNDNDVRFRAQPDSNQGMGWYGNGTDVKNFLSQDVNGPVLYGAGGGVLGTKLGGSANVLTWKAGGRVGINNPAPTEALDVNGNAKANTFQYSTPQTHYLSIPADAFSTTDAGTYTAKAAYTTLTGNNIPVGIYLSGGVAGTAGLVSAPVTLPDSAFITSVTLYAKDNDGTGVAPTVTLSQLSVSTNKPNVTSAFAVNVGLTSESPNFQIVSVPVNAIIDNRNKTTKVAVRLNQNSANTILFSVRITYTVPQPD